MTTITVHIKPLPARLVAQLSDVAESFESGHIGPVVQPLYRRLSAALDAAGVTATGPSMATYADTDDGRVLVTATVEIAARPEGRVGFEVTELPAVPLAVTTVHRGSLDVGPESTYLALHRWIADHGYQPIGYTREEDVECVTRDNWVVELQQPVAAS
jgi:effector-binding domain-containing protein